MKSRPRVLNPNPTLKTAAFTPPPTEAVTMKSMASTTIGYWTNIRISWLSGYKIKWVIPGRDGSVSGSKSVWSLDVRISPVTEIVPARTARYSIEPYVLVAGRPHVEPELGTRVTVKTTLAKPGLEMAPLLVEAPTGLGETARWLPTPASYVDGLWMPQTPPPAPDDGIHWEAAEANRPFINDEFSYARLGKWEITSAMTLQDSHYLRLNGMSMTGQTTLFVVAAVAAPSKYWGSLLRAVEDDGSNELEQTNLDLRLMPDGQLHPFTWGWQQPLPLISENHTLSLFGFSLDFVTSAVRVFTIDKAFRMASMGLYWPHSITSKFVLGRNGEAMHNLDVLDALMYRGPMDDDQIADIANVLDGAYGITARLSQEQG